MGLDFSRPQPEVQTAVLEAENGVEVVEKYDIVADRQRMNTELVGSSQVDALASQIEVYDLETIVFLARKWQMRSPRRRMWCWAA